MVGETVKDLWGALLLRGIMATLFGVAAVFWPGITLVTLVYLFSAFILASGLVGLVTGIMAGKDSTLNRVLVILVSLLEIGVGVYLLRHPFVSFGTLILLISFSLIIHGVFDVIGGLFDGEASAGYRTLVVIAGALAALAGLVLLFQPASAGVAFVWLLGLYALLAGPLMIALAFDVKNNGAKLQKASK